MVAPSAVCAHPHVVGTVVWVFFAVQEEERAEEARIAAREEAIRLGIERKKKEDELFRKQVSESNVVRVVNPLHTLLGAQFIVMPATLVCSGKKRDAKKSKKS